MANKPIKPEILAPVGNFEMCQAAVHNGADAVYIGMPGFNARGRTPTFAIEELKEMIKFCRLHGVKVLLAFNVLIFQRELEEALKLLEEVVKLGPDAFIVQDIGLVRLIKKFAPHQVVHASTQMTVTNYEAIELTKDLDIKRYVLGREVSMPEMQKIKDKTDKELEVFVHGALCVSYSGQCLTSESMGGRSANRGQCAQTCRLPYGLLVDGVEHDLTGRQYLVSPKDLCAIDDVAQLMQIGIDSFKIEGRLKSPEYVATTVRQYKSATLKDEHPSPADLSAIVVAKAEAAGWPEIESNRAQKSPPDLVQGLKQMSVSYSRGFFNGWMDGVNHQKLVDGRYGNHHGLEIGKIREIRRTSIIVATEQIPLPGDGLVFCDFRAAQEFGSNVFEVRSIGKPGLVELSFANEFNLHNLKTGMDVFLNASPSVQKELRRTFTDKQNFKKVPIYAQVSGQLNQPFKLKIWDDANHVVELETADNMSEARSSPLSKESVENELGALGGTCFTLKNLDFQIPAGLFLNNRSLKQLRQRATEELIAKRTAHTHIVTTKTEDLQSWITEPRGSVLRQEASDGKGLSVLIRESNQIEGLSDLPLDTIYLDFEFGKDYDEAVKRVRSLGLKVGIATTRILKPGETGHLKYIERLQPDAILVRNLGALQFFQGKNLNLVGDFSLNVTNSLTAEWLLSKGLQRLCPSYDLNQQQLLDMLEKLPPQLFEITVHQYMPAFHMEHCVFAAFLSNGTSFRDCGRPCEKHRVELRDPKGVLHPLKADAECRNTMFNGLPQSAARLIPILKERGIGSFRVEALYETPTELRTKLLAYSDAIAGKANTNALFERLGIVERYGVTEGQLLNINVYKDRKKAA